MKYVIVALVAGTASNAKEDMNTQVILPAKYSSWQEARNEERKLNEACDAMTFVVKPINN